MYLPPQFKPADIGLVKRLVREHPLASLVTTDDDGAPFLSHLPIHLDAEGEDPLRWRLWGHCAKPNAQSRHLAARPRQLHRAKLGQLDAGFGPGG